MLQAAKRHKGTVFVQERRKIPTVSTSKRRGYTAIIFENELISKGNKPRPGGTGALIKSYKNEVRDVFRRLCWPV